MKMRFQAVRKLFSQYEGIMSIDEMSEEFGIPPATLVKAREVNKHCGGLHRPEHKCWDCAKATDYRKCLYVRTCIGYGSKPKHYEGTELSSEGKILSCPQFIEG